MDPLIDRAIGFASRAHQGQNRKIGDVPYIAHPFGVAMILQQMGCSPQIVAAGLLHDIVEDTPTTLEEIEAEFGELVAAIVAGCTEPPKRRGNWEARKLSLIQSLQDASLPVKLVMAADKYHNLAHTMNASRRLGRGVWERFGRGVEQQAWYYRSVCQSIIANVDQPDRYPIFSRLADLVEQLFSGIPSQPPQPPHSGPTDAQS